jgi:hypothetical protein
VQVVHRRVLGQIITPRVLFRRTAFIQSAFQQTAGGRARPGNSIDNSLTWALYVMAPKCLILPLIPFPVPALTRSSRPFNSGRTTCRPRSRTHSIAVCVAASWLSWIQRCLATVLLCLLLRRARAHRDLFVPVGVRGKWRRVSVQAWLLCF